MITALPPVALSAPQAYEATPGVFAGTVPAGADEIRIASDGRPLRRFHLRAGQRLFSFGPLGLPAHDQTVVVTALRTGTPVAQTAVGPVYGLPRASWRMRPATITDAHAQRAFARLQGRSGAIDAVWARGLASGRAASSNAGATFPAASTLKLAILMTAFARSEEDPVRDGRWSAYRRMILDSSNRTASALLVTIGGSTSGGGFLVNDFGRELGATATDMYGGYLIEPGEPRLAARGRTRTGASVPPVTVTAQPSYPRGKHTTAHDLGVMLTALAQASAGFGPAERAGITGREARVALWLLLHARYPGLVRAGTPYPVAHKAGWLPRLQHDAAIIFAPDGPVVTVVMSDAPGGVSYSASRDWAAAVTRTALRWLRPAPRHT